MCITHARSVFRSRQLIEQAFTCNLKPLFALWVCIGVGFEVGVQNMNTLPSAQTPSYRVLSHHQRYRLWMLYDMLSKLGYEYVWMWLGGGGESEEILRNVKGNSDTDR